MLCQELLSVESQLNKKRCTVPWMTLEMAARACRSPATFVLNDEQLILSVGRPPTNRTSRCF